MVSVYALTALVLALVLVGVYLARTSKPKQKLDKPPAPAPEAGRKAPAEPRPVVIAPTSAPLGSVPPVFSLAPAGADEVDVTRVRPVLEGEEPDTKGLVHFEPGAETASDKPRPALRMPAAGKTDRGITRMRNEDSYLIDADLGLYVIADGMGGYAAGDVASRLAVQEVRAALASGDFTDASEGSGLPRPGRELIAAIERANERIHGEATVSDRTMMGTTLLAARVPRGEQRVYIAHVGDSRCYRLRNGALKQLTTDHTHAARGSTGPTANDLHRAVGIAPTVAVDLIIDRPEAGDLYLLCSDGLPRMVADAELTEILAKWHSDLDRANNHLVLAANGKGGRDNVTVITIAVREGRAASDVPATHVEPS